MRARYTNAAQRYNGLPIERVPNATIAVYTAGTTSTPIPDTIYANSTGGTTLANPFAADPTTGVFAFYLDTQKSVKIRQTSPTTSPVEADYEPVMPAPENIMANVSGGVIFLASYAGGLDIAGGISSAQAAIDAAIAAASASGARIVIGPGTYRGKWVATDGLAVEGAGSGATTLLHPDTTNLPVWTSLGKTGTSLSGVTIDGNRSHNNDAATGYLGVEVECGGLRCNFYDVIVQNYNDQAFLIDGTDNTWDTCYGRGVADATYAPDIGGSASKSAGSAYGFFTGTGSYSLRNRLINCKASGTKLGGYFLGGTDIQIINPQVWDTHRGESLASTVTTVGVVGSGSGGGQIAFTPTAATPGANPGGSPGGSPGTLPANGVLLSCPQIGTTPGAQATGIELQGVVSAEIVAPKVASAAVFGISVLDCQVLTIKGGTLNATSTALWIAGTSRDIAFFGVDFIDHVSKAIHILNSADYVTTSGCRFKTSHVGAVHYTNASSGTHIESAGHQHDNSVVNGGTVPNTFANGITIRSGALTAPQVDTNGLSISSATANAAIFDTAITTAAIRAMLTFREAGANKFHLGMDTDDVFALMNAANNAVNVRVDDSGNATIRGDLTLTGGAYITMATSPTFDQGGAVASTVGWARYKLFGKMAHVQAQLNITAAGTGSNPVLLKLPTSTPNLTPAHTGADVVIGAAIYTDTGTTYRHGAAIASTVASIAILCDAKQGFLGSTSDALTAANTDKITVDLFYETA